VIMPYCVFVALMLQSLHLPGWMPLEGSNVHHMLARSFINNR
jgi:hypothetical protein